MSLQMKGNVEAFVRKYGSKADNTNDGKTAHVTLEINLGEDEAVALGGKDFADGLFRNFVGGSGVARLASGKLSRNLAVKHKHLIKFDVYGDEYPIEAMPDVSGFKTDPKIRAVSVTVLLEIDGGAEKLRHYLDSSCGDMIGFDFCGLVQPDLPATGDDAMPDGAELDEIDAELAGNGAVESAGSQA